MHKGKDCIGLTVISEQTGQVLGKVTDIICSPTFDKIEDLLASEKNSNEIKQLAPSCISSLGRDAVIVNTADLPFLAERNEEAIYLSKLRGLQIVCSDGTELGEVVDVLFEMPLCKIWGLEVSEGFIGDILVGRHSINKDAIKKISQDCILVDF